LKSNNFNADKFPECEFVAAQLVCFLNSIKTSSNSHDLKPNSIVVNSGNRNPKTGHDKEKLGLASISVVRPLRSSQIRSICISRDSPINNYESKVFEWFAIDRDRIINFLILF
jgi:hypothetical protein